MTSAAALSVASRNEVRRIVVISRLAGAMIAVALAGGSVAVHWGDLASRGSVSQLGTVVVGLGAFVTISTLSRMGHVRVLERSLAEVSNLTDRLRDLADRDPLTGLYNMRSFYDALTGAIIDADAGGTAVSLVVADLDNFKALNDSFGHQYGDRVLIQTASRFARAGGAGARAARLGGDEFALLLPGASRAEAVEIAKGVESALREAKIDEAQPPTFGSFGVGTFPHDGRTAQLLFAAADGRMYSEKHGRKSDSLSALSHASSWRVFVRAGHALGADLAPDVLLERIALAAREEFALEACVIRIGDEQATRLAAVAVEQPELAPILDELARRGSLTGADVAAHMPGDAWLIGQPIDGAAGQRGIVLLAGRPQAAYRPDPSVVVALADLIGSVAADERGEAFGAGRDQARAA